MVNEAAGNNAFVLEKELTWFSEVLETRLNNYFMAKSRYGSLKDIPVPATDKEDSNYGKIVSQFRMNAEERIVLLLALIPHIQPQLLDILLVSNENTGRGFTEFGGITSTSHGGFIPTVETALFILAGNNLSDRFSLLKMFDGDHFFSKHHIIDFQKLEGFDNELNFVLTLSKEYLDYLTSGIPSPPFFSASFPARKIITELGWNDLVLPSATVEQLHEIINWVKHGKELMEGWNMKKFLKPGFVSLFHGRPGTGKTLSAGILGKSCEMDVYQVDLSMVVSKYIGETEKNLSRIFDMAENKNWILFFDEADALFGKRTTVADAHDRYANQEISYLLQRIEDFNGVIILASNMKSNIDEAFLRRFQSVIHFPMPRSQERLKIWQNGLSPKAILDKEINIEKIAEKYELSGGTIMNVIRYSSLKAISRGNSLILNEDIEEGVRKELVKEGKSM